MVNRNDSFQPQPTRHTSGGTGCGTAANWIGCPTGIESMFSPTDVCRLIVAVEAPLPEVMNEMLCPGAADSGQQ